MFDHFLITRFNVPNISFDDIDKKMEMPDDNWMDHRLSIFNKLTLPSVIKQKNQNFKWLVVFDERTKSKYKNKINGIWKNYPNFLPVYKPLSISFIDFIKKEILNHLGKYVNYIITTRIDNDDAINVDMIQKIQSTFLNRKQQYLIDFPQGICLQIEPEIKLSLITEYNGHFISLVEIAKGFKTVYHYNHNKWPKSYNRIIIDDDIFWLESIHTNNILNKFKNEKLISNTTILNKFGIEKRNFQLNHRYRILVLIKNFSLFIKSILPGWLKLLLKKVIGFKNIH